jgi:hypothetical protein
MLGPQLRAALNQAGQTYQDFSLFRLFLSQARHDAIGAFGFLLGTLNVCVSQIAEAT